MTAHKRPAAGDERASDRAGAGRHRKRAKQIQTKSGRARARDGQGPIYHIGHFSGRARVWRSCVEGTKSGQSGPRERRGPISTGHLGRRRPVCVRGRLSLRALSCELQSAARWGPALFLLDAVGPSLCIVSLAALSVAVAGADTEHANGIGASWAPTNLAEGARNECDSNGWS